MASVVVLVCHDHHSTITQLTTLLLCVVSLAHLEPYDFRQRLDLSIIRELLCLSIAHIQELSPQWEAAVLVSPNNFDASECQGFC